MSLYNTTLNQPYLFGMFLYLGILLGVLYSVFRGIRKILGNSTFVLILADAVFLLAAAGGLFFLFRSVTHFQLRGYHFLGTALGFGLYLLSVPPLIRCIICKFHKKKIDNDPRG